MSRKQAFTGIMLAALLVSLVVTAAAPAQAQDRRLRVVASFSILADVARNVAGDAADVASLIPLGANPHAFTPSAQDVVTLSNADLVLVVGAGYEEGLIDVLQETGGDNVRVASDCVPIRPVSGGGPVGDTSDENAHEEPAACEAHHAAVYGALEIDPEREAESGAFLGVLADLACSGAAHDDEAGDDGAHEAGSCDPHVWTDPVNAGLWALMIRDVLAELDPANAGIYAANADAYLGELAALHQDIGALIDAVPADRRAIVTNHLAFNYLAGRYGLELVGVVIPGGSTTSEPSVQQVLSLIETIQTHNVPAIFTETTVSESIAQQIAGETGAQIVRLYTGSLSQPGDGADTYLAYMRFNAGAIAGALQ
jgi:ABC-type Zn uptake system ZnuABC Zn-binding protein ZnuA